MLQVSSRLDTSSTSVYFLCVTATDGQHSSTVPLNITLTRTDDLSDPLQFSQPYYVFDVPEDWAPGVVVGQVLASVDVVGHQASSSSSSSSSLSYAVVETGLFNISATHGILTLTNTLDHETVRLSLTFYAVLTLF